MNPGVKFKKSGKLFGNPRLVNILDFTNEYSFIMTDSKNSNEDRTNFIRGFFDQNYPIVENGVANISDWGSSADYTLSYRVNFLYLKTASLKTYKLYGIII